MLVFDLIKTMDLLQSIYIDDSNDKENYYSGKAGYVETYKKSMLQREVKKVYAHYSIIQITI